MTLKSRVIAAGLGVVAALAGPAAVAASFEARSLDANPTDAEAWYDAASGLTWLRDLVANASAAGLYADSVNTSSYLAAASWADALVAGGSSDWRIPALPEAQALQLAGLLSPAYFDGMGTASGAGGFWVQGFMWTSTALTPGVSQYLLRIAGEPLGAIDAAIHDRGFQVFAVSAGDIGQPLSPVPEPSAFLLLGLGLGGLALARRTINPPFHPAITGNAGASGA